LGLETLYLGSRQLEDCAEATNIKHNDMASDKKNETQEVKKEEEDSGPGSAPALMRQLSSNSKDLLTKAFEQLDAEGTGFITRKEALKFYDTFCQAKTMSMMSAILKESASMMVKEFDKRHANGIQKISFDEFASFFHELQIPDDKLEEILLQFVPAEAS